MKAFIHPTAIVEGQVGERTKVWHFVHIREDAVVGKECNIGKGVYIDRGVKIGDRVKIQNFVSVYSGVTIEDDVFIGPSVTFTNDLYPRAFLWDETRRWETFVRRGASIGANATVLCGIEIGEYAMVGAGSVVTSNVPPHGLVYGNPARLRGFVCYCGHPLKEKVREEDKEVVYYRCSVCGEIVKISKVI